MINIDSNKKYINPKQLHFPYYPFSENQTNVTSGRAIFPVLRSDRRLEKFANTVFNRIQFKFFSLKPKEINCDVYIKNERDCKKDICKLLSGFNEKGNDTPRVHQIENLFIATILNRFAIDCSTNFSFYHKGPRDIRFNHQELNPTLNELTHHYFQVTGQQLQLKSHWAIETIIFLKKVTDLTEIDKLSKMPKYYTFNFFKHFKSIINSLEDKDSRMQSICFQVLSQLGGVYLRRRDVTKHQEELHFWDSVKMLSKDIDKPENILQKILSEQYRNTYNHSQIPLQKNVSMNMVAWCIESSLSKMYKNERINVFNLQNIYLKSTYTLYINGYFCSCARLLSNLLLKKKQLKNTLTLSRIKWEHLLQKYFTKIAHLECLQLTEDIPNVDLYRSCFKIEFLSKRKFP